MVKILYARLIRSIQQSAVFVRPNLFFIGLVGVIGFPLYYVIWEYIFPQEYENIPLRIIGCLSFIPFVFHKKLFKKHKKIFSIYWFITFLYALPFFFTYMLLMNGASAVWGMSTMAAILLLFLVIDDWVLINIIFLTGTLLGWTLYLFTGWQEGVIYAYLEQVPIYFFALFSGSIFSHKAELIKNERQYVMLSVGSNIAHELRTPLSGIQSGIDGLRKYLPTLIEGYKYAENKKPDLKNIRSGHLYTLETLLERVSNETTFSNAIIDMLLVKSGQVKIEDKNFEYIHANDCVQLAIDRYPFQRVEEKELIQVNCENDFAFKGSEILFAHIIFNLLKNSLYFIHKAQKGKIFITIESDTQQDIIRFKDTSLGIKSATLPYVFDQFYSTLESGRGAGIGLYFCKFVMRSFGGDIKVISNYGEFAEFSLVFREEK